MILKRGVSEDHPIFARLWPHLSGRIVPPRRRRELLEGLEGRVVEIGAGDGPSFAHYPASVTEVVAVEPEPHLRALASTAADGLGFGVSVTDGRAEALPLASGSCDAAVSCLVLCSVSDQAEALAELRRVVRPGGRLRFYEHVVAGAPATRAVQRGLDASRLWPTVSGGCHLSRDTLAAIGRAGFEVGAVRQFTSGPNAVGVPFLLGEAVRSA